MTHWEDKLRKFVSPVALIATGLFTSVFFTATIWRGVHHQFDDVFHNHLPTVIGLPGAAVASLCLVIVLRSVTGDIKFTIGRLASFEGASGPIIMWILCFLSMTFAIHYTWALAIAK
jgi:hypothetical protein